MGYAISDVNHDGCAELFLMDEQDHIYAVFSQRNEKPILLGSFGVNNHDVALDQNGTFYQTGYGKGENAYTKIMQIAPSGDFEVLLEYGCSDDGTNDQYYVIENHVKKMIDLQEMTVLQEKYHSFLQNPSETTKSSGLRFISVTDGCRGCSAVLTPRKAVWLLPRLIAICYPCVQRLFRRISQSANDLCGGLRCIIHCKCLFLLLPCVHNPFLSSCPGFCPQGHT